MKHMFCLVVQSPQTYSLPGLTSTYKLQWKYLKGSSAAESGLTDFNQDLRYPGASHRIFQSPWFAAQSPYLFENGVVSAQTLFNPIVLTEIELPTGQKYKFTYDVFGRIESITYPTGGSETFTYQLVPALGFSSSPSASDQVNYGVLSRKVYETAGTGTPYEWTFGATENEEGYKISETAPDQTITERTLHRDFSECLGCETGTWGFSSGLAGRPYDELHFSSDGHLVSRKLTHWTKTEFTVQAGTAYADWHPRADHEETITYDLGGNGVSTTTKTEYEGDLSVRTTPMLVKKSTEYAFVVRNDGGSILPGATPVPFPTPVATPTPPTAIKIVELTYLINDPNYSSVKANYINQNMIGLVTVSQVKNGAGTVVGQTESVYDETGRSPGYRGNLTTAKAWDSTKGLSTSASAYVSTHAKFDMYGNQYEATDALGNTTTTTFDATYNAFPVNVTSPIPDPSGIYGSTSAFVATASFDTTTGLPLTTTDANGLKTAIEYDSATLRPRYTRTYNGATQLGGTNETIYHDEADNTWVKVKKQIDDFHYDETTTYFDGLGRPWKTEQLNSGGDIFVEKQFDANGRVSRVTNPYRSGDTKQWTTNVYDTSSRVVEIDLPDTSKVYTSYGVSTSGVVGVTKQITDQAGKKRKGYTDALGNMIRVVEDPDGSALATDYTFDTLGNLRKTFQGAQSRYFWHDSLGRLIYARQIEQNANSAFSGLSYTDPVTSNNQWSVKYVYDDNGNITSTTDARNNSVSATYDHLNRLTLRNYSEATADVTFYYDGKGLTSIPAFANGKTTKVTSSVSETRNLAFDIFGRVLSARQTTDGANYDTSYTYDLAGALIEETYPSGRVVKNSVDENGELEQVQSKKNANAGYWQYAGSFSRDSAGNVTKMQLGNGKWETASYNNRAQIIQIGLGGTDSTQDLLKLEYAYNTTGNHDNNGSLLEQKITVPTVGSNAGFTATQTYTYDGLNRLGSATETVSATQTWKQEFSYDRYGNKNFVTGTGHTTTLGGCATAVCNPSFDTNTTTNRFATGQGYSYDANGNITQDASSQRFGFDAENHQTQFFGADNPGSTPDATYYYDGEGKRVKKISATETTVFVYDAAGRVVAEYSTALASTPQVSYLTQDQLGSTRIISNENGAITNRKDFMPFGDAAVSAQRVSGVNGNGYNVSDFRQDFTAYEKDSESQLEFAQARYDNPVHGRFTSVDALMASASAANPQTFNRYSYVMNQPTHMVDPSGLSACSAENSYSDCGGDDGFVNGEFGDDTAEYNRAKRANGVFTDFVDRILSIRRDGWDPEMNRYWGAVEVQLLAADGTVIEKAVLTNPTLDQVYSQALVFSNGIRRNQARQALTQRGWDKHKIDLVFANEGFTFIAKDDEARTFLIDELSKTNFDASSFGLFFVSHAGPDQADCSNGGCVDYRSRDGVISHGRMQVVYNEKLSKGYVDVDRFAPHGQGIHGFLGHAFLEVMYNSGGGMQNVRGLRYGGFPVKRIH